MSGRQKLDTPVDSHLISLVGTSHCPLLLGKVEKQLLAGQDANPHRMSLLGKEKGKNVSSSQTSPSQPMPQSATCGDEETGPKKLSNFTHVSKWVTRPGLTEQ